MLAAAVTLTVALAVAGAGAAPGGAAAPAPDARTSDAVAPVRPAAGAGARATSPQDRVATAVRRARAGAPIPETLRPPPDRLDADVADLGGCDYATSTRRLCARGDRTSPTRTVVVLGDSHGRFWIPAFEGIGPRHSWRAFYLVKEQCTAAHVMPAKVGTGARFTGCRDFQEWAERQVRRLKPQLVVVSTSAPSAGVYVDGRRVTTQSGIRAEMRRGYGRLISAVRPAAGRMAFLRDVPRSKTDPQPCLAGSGNDLGDCLWPPAAPAEAMAQVAADVARQRGVPVLDTRRWTCFDGACPAVVGDVVTYRDFGHLTTTYVRTLRDALARGLWMTG